MGAGDIYGDGSGLLVLTGVDTSSRTDGSMYVGSLTGHGLNGTNLTLLASAAAAQIPDGYWWPGGQLHNAVLGPNQQPSGSPLAVAVAVPIVIVSAAAAAAAAAALLLWRRLSRQRRHPNYEARKGFKRSEDSLLPEVPVRSGSLGRASSAHCELMSGAINKDASGSQATSAEASQLGVQVPAAPDNSAHAAVLEGQLPEVNSAELQQPSCCLERQPGSCELGRRQQQQLFREGLALLRARPHGTLALQDYSHESYHAWFAGIQAGPDGCQASPDDPQAGAECRQAWKNDSGARLGNAFHSSGTAWPASASEWHTANQTATRDAASCLTHLPAGPEQDTAVGCSNTPQQQNQAVTPAEAGSQLCSAGDGSGAGGPTSGVVQRQCLSPLLQQMDQSAAATAVLRTSGLARPVARSTAGGSRRSAAALNTWQRVSGAIRWAVSTHSAECLLCCVAHSAHVCT